MLSMSSVHNRARQHLPLAIILAVAVGGVVLLHLYNPATTRIFPPCMLHSLTGLYCPGCGSLRAIHYLLHGQFAAALRMNPLLVLSGPAILVISLSRRIRHHPATPIVAVVVVVTYGILRNIPCWPFTLLAPGTL
jgi:hypothetical protein